VSPQLLVLLVFIMDLTSSFISILVGYQAFKCLTERFHNDISKRYHNEKKLRKAKG